MKNSSWSVETQVLTVAGWNIHRYLGRGGRDVNRTIRVIRELDADVTGLQEVVAGSQGGTLPTAHELSEATNREAVFGPTLLHRHGKYGNALLTRLPIKDVRRHDLSMDGREPRGLLDVILDAGGRDLRVVNTHLGLTLWERSRQVQNLLDILERDHSGPMVLMGDFNEWIPFHISLKPIVERFGHTPSPRTFPARFPIFPLDRVWTTPEGTLKSLEVHDSPLARLASDHLPVKARVALVRDTEAAESAR